MKSNPRLDPYFVMLSGIYHGGWLGCAVHEQPAGEEKNRSLLECLQSLCNFPSLDLMAQCSLLFQHLLAILDN